MPRERLKTLSVELEGAVPDTKVIVEWFDPHDGKTHIQRSPIWRVPSR
jgi:hypothetical protein